MSRIIKRFQNRITTGRFTFPAAFLIALFCWVMADFLLPSVKVTASDYRPWQLIGGFTLPHWLNTVISFLLYVAVAWLLVVLNNVFAIIRIRASVQTSFYLLLCAVCPVLHRLWAGDVAALALLAALFFLLGSYQCSRPMVMLFHSFCFLGLGSLALPQLTFLAPLFWIGAYRFQSLNLRSFCASLLGWSLPYWFLFGHAFFHDEMELFYRPFIELATFQPFFVGLEPWMLATLGYVGLLFLICVIRILTRGYDDKLRTRGYLQFFILLVLALLLYICLQPMVGLQLFSSLFIGISILAAHYFVLTNSRASNLFFMGTLLGLMFLFGYNVWTLL